MLNKIIIQSLIAAVIGLAWFPASAQSTKSEMMTLFTTSKERSLIDGNRYRKEVKKSEPAQVIPEEEPAPVEEKAVSMVEHKIRLEVSGVTVTQSGQNIAWINGRSYENGSKLEDGSVVYINKKLKTLVQIKTPDGKFHSAEAGTVLDLTYFMAQQG